MPPPRRRRPVQPATRVRLPRAARARADAEAPPAGSADRGLPPGKLQDEAPPAEVSEPPAESPAPGDVTEAADQAEPTGEITEPAVQAAPEPADDAEDADREPAQDRDQAASDQGTGSPRRHPLLVPACLGVVAIALGGLATWFGVEAGGAGGDTQNVALINPSATRQVSRQISAAVNTIFSYNYADTAKTSQAAGQLLTGQASSQYNTLFKLVTQDAPQEKLILTTTVTSAGVESLDGNQARLLIFVNQSDTSNSAHKTTEAGAMFAVNAVRQGGTWKISNINDFAGT